MKTTCLILFLSVLVALPCSAGWPAPGGIKIDERLQKTLTAASPVQDIPVIIHLTERADLRAAGVLRGKERRALMINQLRVVAQRSQQALRSHLQGRGIVQLESFWVINAMAASLPAGMIIELAARPEVASIILDATVSLPEPETTGLPVEPTIALTGAPVLWARGITGQGVVVATLDSGADVLHADLGPRWRGGNNSWYDPSGQHPTDPIDHYGHGTGVLSVLVGGSATGSAIGVAPGAKWIAVKLFDDFSSNPTYSTIYAAYQWLFDPDGNPATDDAPDVVNNSWILGGTTNRCYPMSTEFLELLQLFRDAGIAVVFAAGNTGPGAATSVSPASNPGAFVVGAVGTMQSQTEVSNFSARGPSACDDRVYPDIVASGYTVHIADLTHGGVFPTASKYHSGTSYAAPAVSGVIALLRGVFPEVAVPALENVLRRTAQDIDMAGPDNSSGYGLISAPRAFAALNARPGIVGTYAAGLWSLDANGNNRWDGIAGGDERVRFGTVEMLPVAGDWNGNGSFDVGTFAGGKWYLDIDGNRTRDTGDQVFRFGRAGDLPVVGDWNGDGITDVGVVRQNLWILDGNGNHLRDAGDLVFRFGVTGDLPVVGDWNGDGISDAGVFRTGAWILDGNGNHARDPGDLVFRYGQGGDQPVTGDWNDDGNLDVGVFRAGRWYLDANSNRKSDAGDLIFTFGTAERLPVTFR